MAEGRGLLDTSTVILLGRIEPGSLPARPLISAVTLAELAVGPLVAKSEIDRAERIAHLRQAEADLDALPFDAEAAHAFGRVAAALHQLGRKPAARAFDAMIAATAVANDLPLYTCNPADFPEMAGLTVIAIPHPDGEASAP